jgi:hypothetical protein
MAKSRSDFALPLRVRKGLAANLHPANSPAARRKGLEGCEAATARSAGAVAIAESRKAWFFAVREFAAQNP